MTDELIQATNLDVLAALREELQAVGMVVVPSGDELHVRLSMLDYIKIRVEGGTLHCEPWVGVAPRSRATWTLVGISAALIPGLLLRSGGTPATLAVAFLAVTSLVFNLFRHLLSDNNITRIQMAWLVLRPGVLLAQSGALAYAKGVSRQVDPGTTSCAEQLASAES